MAEDDELRAAAGRPTNGYDLGRLLAFSDGVFAIAITLLVLNIPVPNLPAGTGPDEIRGALLALKPNLGGFVLSFFLVGTYWIGHHRLLLGANRLDGAGLWLNLFVLATVCLIPFSSGVLIRYGDTVPGFWVYAANQGLAGVGFFLLRLNLRRLGAAVPGSDLRTSFIAPVFLISMPVAIWDVRAAYALWFLGAAVSRFATLRQGRLLPAPIRRLLPTPRAEHTDGGRPGSNR